MKKQLSLILFVALISTSQAAFYENTSYNNEDPTYLKSMVVNTQGCEKEGVLVKFFGNSKDYEFCDGFAEITKHEYKKCVGREVGAFPFGKRCLGYNKTVVEITKKVASVNGSKMTRVQTTHRDGELIHKDVMVLVFDGDQAQLETSFINNDWNGSGEEIYIFAKKID